VSIREPQRIVLAGGGTAGHIEPALAVADEIKKLRPDLICEFLGTDGALEQRLVPNRGYKLERIRKVVLPRAFAVSSFVFPFRLAVSIWQASRVLKGAQLLIGFGGYVSAPAYLAAAIRGVPIFIHEANAKPGWANKLGKNFAKVIAINFDEVRNQWPSAISTGMPIRKSLSDLNAISDKSDLRSQSCNKWGFDPKLPIVAVFGGSQGSQHINQVIKDSLNGLSEIQIIHAVGINNPLPSSAVNYLPLSYFDDMSEIYACADLLVTRSGAVTCAELESLGKFAILIPLPHGNGEQIDNAKALVEKGAAVMVANEDFNPEWFKKNVGGALEKAAKYRPLHTGVNDQAAHRIAQLALNLLDKSQAEW
jgi:UDP-N-acetylglucosamine--N-acetylmuramyl-(pentapeptide) pyrophosphoryl-undecaprenol N-acetylglucosamine transferase